MAALSAQQPNSIATSLPNYKAPTAAVTTSTSLWSPVNASHRIGATAELLHARQAQVRQRHQWQQELQACIQRLRIVSRETQGWLAHVKPTEQEIQAMCDISAVAAKVCGYLTVITMAMLQHPEFLQ